MGGIGKKVKKEKCLGNSKYISGNCICLEKSNFVQYRELNDKNGHWVKKFSPMFLFSNKSSCPLTKTSPAVANSIIRLRKVEAFCVEVSQRTLSCPNNSNHHPHRGAAIPHVRHRAVLVIFEHTCASRTRFLSYIVVFLLLKAFAQETIIMILMDGVSFGLRNVSTPRTRHMKKLCPRENACRVFEFVCRNTNVPPTKLVLGTPGWGTHSKEFAETRYNHSLSFPRWIIDPKENLPFSK